MWVKIFDVQDGVIRPSEQCYTLKTLKAIIDAYPEDHMIRYLYIFYMTCPDPLSNPFFNLPEDEKQSVIIQEIKADFSLDDPLMDAAIAFCNSLYDTPTKRAYEGIKIMMDKLATFFRTQSLSTGRDGSLTPMVGAAEKYQKLRESYKGIEKDYNDEIKNRVRGDRFKSYDQ
jgi:hypothetical protein